LIIPTESEAIEKPAEEEKKAAKRKKRVTDVFMIDSPAEVNNRLENGTISSVDREKEKTENITQKKKLSIKGAPKCARPYRQSPCFLKMALFELPLGFFLSGKSLAFFAIIF
jgi:hypothetical protein